MGLIDKIEEFKLNSKFKYFFFGMLCVLFPLVITIYGVFYFGGLWDPVSRLKNLKVSIVNKDIPCPMDGSNLLCLAVGSRAPEVAKIKLGDLIVQGIMENPESGKIFDWQLENDLDMKQAQKTVQDYDRWGVIYIPEDFTQSIISQLDMSAMATPEGLGQLAMATHKTQEEIMRGLQAAVKTPEIHYIYETARSYTSVTFVSTVFETIDRSLKKTIALSLYQRVVVPGTGAFKNSFYLNAFDSKFDDLRTINNFGQNFASFILFVVVYIAAIATTLVYRKYRPFNNYIQSDKSTKSIFVSACVKICINMIYMILVSSFMMLVVFMFGNAQHEKSTFCAFLIFVVWAFISLSFCQLISNLLPLLPFLGVCVIFLVIQLATCSGIIAVQLQPGFWNIGKALPMYYATAEMKYLLFDTGGRFSGRNVLALLLWAVGLAVVDFISSLVQLRNVRNKAPNGSKDLEKQEMTTNNNRVTKQDIENNPPEGDITNMH